MAALDTVEVERKYDVDQSASVPLLTGLPDVEQVGPPVTHHLEATYFDTEDYSLAAHGITLRRRTGGTDAGWHLKLPLAANTRNEITEPLRLEGDAVPDRLRHLVSVHVRNRPLVPVARLRTRRITRSLQGAGLTVLAEFTDDHVESEAPLGQGLMQSWREWEIELVEGSEGLLEAADGLLSAAGVNPAQLPSKLARALGPSYPQQAPGLSPKRKGAAAKVLLAYLRKQVDALKSMDPGVREDAPDSVHQLRVSARRMRSALATYRKLVDAEQANHLRDELKWLAGTVGQARDIEVMRERLKEMTTAEPLDLLVGPVAQRIEEESDDRYRQAREVGLAAMDGERYFRLLDSLDAFVAEPPRTALAGKKAGKTVAWLVARDLKRLRKAVRAVEEAEDAPEVDGAAVDAALHEVRKSAKRLRYAAESAAPIHGKRAKKLAKAAEQIQETLGILQDSVVSRQHLRDLAAQAHADGDSAFTFGRLHALEQARADEARTQFSHDWAQFRPKPLR